MSRHTAWHFHTATSIRWPHLPLLFSAILWLASPGTSAQTALPRLEGNFLLMPAVQVFDTPYRIDWQVVVTGELIDLLLHEFEQLPDGTATAGAPSFQGEVLNLPRLDLDGKSLWGEFLLDSEQPIIFRLIAVGENDGGVSGMQGKWRIIEEIDALGCEVGELIEIYTIEIREAANQTRIAYPFGEFEASVTASRLSWSDSYAVSGGSLSTSVELLFNETRDSLSGDATWTFDDGTASCQGSSVLQGDLLHH